MGNKPIYSSLIRSAWLTLTIFLVIFCGPFKKLIELRVDNTIGIVSSPQAIYKTLHTGYREKHDIAPLVHTTQQQSPVTGFPFFLLSSFLLIILLLRKDTIFKLRHISVATISEMPLYLHFRKLQI